MLLADMRAEVVKVEPPWGDASRSSPQHPSVEGQNSYYMFVNRNKKSIVLALKSETGVEARGMIVERQHPLGFMYRTVATGVKFSETPAPCSLMGVGATDDYDSFLTTQILDTSACRVPVYRDSIF